MLWVFGLFVGFLSLFIFIFAKLARWKIICWLSGLPLFLIGLPSALVFCWGLVYEAWVSNPTNAFQATFAIPPDQDVTDIKSDVGYYWDSYSAYLKFHTSPATVQKLVVKHKMVLSKSPDEINALHDNNAPAWWTPTKTTTTKFYVPIQPPRNFSSERKILSYDSATQTAYYAYVGID